MKPTAALPQRTDSRAPIQIIGRLTKDPELTTTKAGQALCRMRVAVRRPGSDAEAVYIDVVAWERLAETCGEALRCPAV